jgi:hypothetical protein
MPENSIAPYTTDNSPNSKPELSAKPVDKKPIIIGILVALVVIIIFGGLGWWLFINPSNAALLRDIFIIFMGLGIFVVILLLIALVVITAYLVIKVNDLVQLLDREVRPMLTKMQASINTVRGTTTFLSDHAVQPVIATASTVAAIRVIISSLFRRN